MSKLQKFKQIRYSKYLVKLALATIAVVGWTMGLATSVFADAAPPASPPGSNIEPGGSNTMVQMVAEYVLLQVDPSGTSVSVSADFAMRNQGTKTEVLAVRFPLENPNGYGDGYGNHSQDSQINNFSVLVDDTPVPFKVIVESYTADDDPIPWAVFEVKFPPSEDVSIRVKYATEPYGNDGATIEYVLGTGAGWFGPIGSAAITLQLPYAVSPTNVPFVNVGRSDLGITYIGNEVRWQAQNYEPDPYDQFVAGFIWPSYWEEILVLESRISEEPSDLEAVLTLAEAYRHKDEVKGYIPSDEFFALSDYTILQALALDPSNPDLNAELAFNRWLRFPVDILNALDVGPSDPFELSAKDVDHPVVQNILRVLMIALRGNPDNPKALEVLDGMRSWLGDFEFPDEIPVMDLPIHTPTPDVIESIAPTKTMEAGSIKLILWTATPQPTATKIMPTPTFSQEPTMSAESGSHIPKETPWLDSVIVGLGSVVLGACLGYVIAKRKE